VADKLVRWAKFKGMTTFFTTGTDEHGLKIQQAANRQQNMILNQQNIVDEQKIANPKEFCDKISQRFKDLVVESHSKPDLFIRTTDEAHIKGVIHLWKRLESAGLIYKGFHEGWYSVSDEAFVPDAQIIIQNGVRYSEESGHPLEWVKEENYKFALSKFRGKLLDWLKNNPFTIYPHSQQHYVSKMIQNEMQDLSVSRLTSKVSWGIPVPGDPSHTMYVWLDALANYLTATGYPWDDTSSFPNRQEAFPADLHIVGKDILKFHSIYWPAFLMGAGLPPPRRIIAHGHWTVEGEKMSKSKGNVVDPFMALKKHGVDQLRYFLLRYGSFIEDGDYSDTQVEEKTFADLADNLGNLVNRITSQKLNQNQCWPEPNDSLTTEDKEIVQAVEKLPETVQLHFDNFEFQKGLTVILDVSQQINKYLNLTEPWTLTKGKLREDLNRLNNIIHTSLGGCRVVALLLQSTMPKSMATLLDMLGVDQQQRTSAFLGWKWNPINTKIKSAVLFPKNKA